MSLSSPSVKAIDGADFRVGIVAARFNEALVDGLLSRVIAELSGPYNIIQGADVAPTAQAVKAAEAALATFDRLMGEWTKLRDATTRRDDDATPAQGSFTKSRRLVVSSCRRVMREAPSDFVSA